MTSRAALPWPRSVTPVNGEIRYLVLADRAVPYLLARVRWPDVAQAISAGCPDWLDDIGLFDLPYDPKAVPVSFTQAASVAAGWGRKLGTEPAVNAPSFIRRMPANWSEMTPGERRAFGLEPAGRRRLPVRRLRRIRAVPGDGSAPRRPSARPRTSTRAGACRRRPDLAERRHQVRVRVDGRGHIRSGQSTVSAALVDLSEGGMRCVLPDAPLRLTPGQELGGPFLLEGEAARARICLAGPGRISWILDRRFGHAFRRDLRRPEWRGSRRRAPVPGHRRQQARLTMSATSTENGSSPAGNGGVPVRRTAAVRSPQELDYRLRGLILDPEGCPPAAPAQPERQRRRPRRLGPLAAKAAAFVIAAALAGWLLQAFVAQPFVVPGSAMAPAIPRATGSWW